MNTESSHGRQSGDTAEHLADFLMLAQRSCFLDISRELNAGKISYAQLFLLGCLAETNSLTMSEIARKMGHSTAAATGLVDRLQKLGYVDRTHAEEDRRKIMVAITESGREQVVKTREGLANSLARMLAEWDTSGKSEQTSPLGRSVDAVLPDGVRLATVWNGAL